jgi:hypothetical protein
MKIHLVLAASCCVPLLAHAAACEDSFIKKGNVLTGLRFTASMQVADLNPATAIQQLHGIALARGYDVLDEEAEEGSMLIEQRSAGSARSFPIVVTATESGNVSLAVKMPAGMVVEGAAVKGELCTMLGQVRGGSAGLAAAADAGNVVAAAPVVKIEALTLSHNLSRETEKGAENIPLRYKGKAYTITGYADYVLKDGDAYRVAYKIPDPSKELLNAPGQPVFKTDISCLMAKGQNAYSLTVKKGQRITLTGVYRDFDQFCHVIWFENCRPEMGR